MRTHFDRIRAWTPAIALALALGAPAVAWAGDEKPVRHQDVGPAKTCIDCHGEITPDVVAEWDAGSHGKFNVKCFVCHGSTGDDFVAVPEGDRCIGCHADKVVSLHAAGIPDRGCWACHPGHLLNPHARVETKKGGQE